MVTGTATTANFSVFPANTPNPNWMSQRLRPSAFGSNKNRSGHSFEHAEALRENEARKGTETA